jgi:hypothetical protein
MDRIESPLLINEIYLIGPKNLPEIFFENAPNLEALADQIQ